MLVSTATACSLILAAGRGTRMKGYKGNKALLPLIPEEGPFVGKRPFIEEILDNLPKGPKGIVVHHDKEALIVALGGKEVSFIEQPVLNGTGGALLCAKGFLEGCGSDNVIVTMGDVPLVRCETFLRLLEELLRFDMVALGFLPQSRRQFGLFITEGENLREIVEWKYWKDWDSTQIDKYPICNSGIYAFRRQVILQLLPELEKNPHEVRKEIDGKIVSFTEYFLTDIVSISYKKGFRTGYKVVNNPYEVTGVDDPDSLKIIQALYLDVMRGLDSSA